MNRLVFSIILGLLTLTGFAQTVSFTASGPDAVNQGGRFQVEYTLNASGNNFDGPDFKGFRVLTGPNQSSSSSISVINGNLSKSTQLTYSYILQANSVGTLTIDPASVRVDGKLYNSNKLTIRVEKSQQSSNTQSSNTTRSAQTSQKDTKNRGKDVFIKANLNKTSPYLGEQIILSYRIYTKVQIKQIEPKNGSTFPGFWMQDLLKDSPQMKQQKEFINGEEYISAELKRVALFPMKTGKITIDPFEVSTIAQYRKQRSRNSSNDPFDSFFNDSFFNMGVENVELNLRSEGYTVNVKDLPENNKPASFTGSVGKFTLKSSIDRQTLNANDAITVKYTVNGSGNIPLLKLPELQLHSDLEAFEPKVSQHVKRTANGISGSISYEYLIIPRSAGSFEIPAMNFSFFNPATKKYETLTAEAYPITVNKAVGQATGISYSAVSQEDVKYIGSDIRHIRLLPFELKTRGEFFFGSTKFMAALVLPILILILLIVFVKRREKQRGNIDLMRNRKATKIAKKRLKKGQDALKNNQPEHFFDEISMALWGYLSDKFTIPRSELSMESVSDYLIEKGVGKPTIDQIISILENCEFARFAPGDKTENMAQTYKDSMNVISQIEQGLK